MPAACFRRSVDVDAGVSGGRTNVGTAGPLIDLNAWTGRPCHAVNIPRHSEAPVVTLNRVRAVSHGVACAAPATNLRTMWRMAPAHHRDASQLSSSSTDANPSRRTARFCCSHYSATAGRRSGSTASRTARSRRFRRCTRQRLAVLALAVSRRLSTACPHVLARLAAEPLDSRSAMSCRCHAGP